MGYIAGEGRKQTIRLFPEVLDDYVSEDNPVRFIDAFVEALDMNALGFVASDGQRDRATWIQPARLVAAVRVRVCERGAVEPEKLDESGQTQVSLADPDARMMKTRQGVHPCYNVQIATDSKHRPIVFRVAINDISLP